MKEGNIVICCDKQDEHFLSIGMVVEINTSYIDGETVDITYQDGKTVSYALWKTEGCFKKVITENL